MRGQRNQDIDQPGKRDRDRRCSVPAYAIAEVRGRLGGFAGLWRPMPDGAGEAFTLLTTEPGPDIAPIHNRQMVVLDRSDWLAWLELKRPEPEFLRPLPASSLAVE